MLHFLVIGTTLFYSLKSTLVDLILYLQSIRLKKISRQTDFRLNNQFCSASDQVSPTVGPHKPNLFGGQKVLTWPWVLVIASK